jgi:hypothetical protein
VLQVEYIRREVKSFDEIDSDLLINKGFVEFGEEPELAPRFK